MTSLDTRLNALRFPLYPHEAETTHPRGGGHCETLIFLLASRRVCVVPVLWPGREGRDQIALMLGNPSSPLGSSEIRSGRVLEPEQAAKLAIARRAKPRGSSWLCVTGPHPRTPYGAC